MPATEEHDRHEELIQRLDEANANMQKLMGLVIKLIASNERLNSAIMQLHSATLSRG